MKHKPENKAAQLASLISDYPELAEGLDQLLTDDTDQAVSIVGIFSLLQLRLRAVVSRLPQLAPPSDETPPGESR
jgi:hypothetical protein